jgi:hypothetical protein
MLEVMMMRTTPPSVRTSEGWVRASAGWRSGARSEMTQTRTTRPGGEDKWRHRRGDEDDAHGARDEAHTWREAVLEAGAWSWRWRGRGSTTAVDPNKLVLGKGKDDGDGSRSRRHARTGEARAGPPAETAREVCAWRRCWRQWGSSSGRAVALGRRRRDDVGGEERRRYIGGTFSPRWSHGPELKVF